MYIYNFIKPHAYSIIQCTGIIFAVPSFLFLNLPKHFLWKLHSNFA